MLFTQALRGCGQLSLQLDAHSLLLCCLVLQPVHNAIQLRAPESRQGISSQARSSLLLSVTTYVAMVQTNNSGNSRCKLGLLNSDLKLPNDLPSLQLSSAVAHVLQQLLRFS